MSKWSDYEEKFLIEKLPYCTSKELERRFKLSPLTKNRSAIAIESKAKRMGINHDFSASHYSIAEFSEMTGANINTIQQHCLKGILSCERLRGGHFGIPVHGSDELIEKYKDQYAFNLSDYVTANDFAMRTGSDVTTIRKAFKYLKPITVLRKKYIHKSKLKAVEKFLKTTGKIRIEWEKALND